MFSSFLNGTELQIDTHILCLWKIRNRLITGWYWFPVFSLANLGSTVQTSGEPTGTSLKYSNIMTSRFKTFNGLFWTLHEKGMLEHVTVIYILITTNALPITIMSVWSDSWTLSDIRTMSQCHISPSWLMWLERPVGLVVYVLIYMRLLPCRLLRLGSPDR